MLDEYLKELVREKWRDAAAGRIKGEIKSRIKVWARRMDRDVPDLDDADAVAELMCGVLTLGRITKADYDFIKLLPQFDEYVKLIDRYTESVGTLYENMARRCSHYYHGTAAAELDSLLESREKWAGHYDHGYCCMSLVPAAALDKALENHGTDEDCLVIRYSKDLASAHITKPGYGLGDAGETDMDKPARLHRMHEMEIRLASTADPKSLGMEIISFATDPQKRKELTERYGSLGRIIFARPDAEDILKA